MNTVYTRLEYLFTPDEINKLKCAKVCVVGAGGVGGMAIEVLARSGIGTIIVCDFDKVNITNTNRQVIANINNYDKPKTECFKDFIYNINPDIKVITISERYDENSNLFDYEFDYLIDAIDDINNKLLLIKKAIQTNKVFISSMGTAKKLDSTKLKVTEISKTSYDPIAKILRKKLRDEHINDKVYVVSSTEEVNSQIKLGSYMPVVATAGILCADFIIKKIINK